MTKKTIGLISLLLAVMAIISYFGIIKPTNLSKEISEDSSSKNNDITIVIVNEDSGTMYNGQQLNVGALLAESFGAKSGYSVEVVTRSIADKGLENDVYQLMVILPSNFSQDSLALESSSPQQAVFQYKIKSDKTFLVKQAEQAVVDLKGLFNQDLIHIYFLSIIGNLQRAQRQVGDVVTAQDQVLVTFDSQLMTPLAAYAKQFDGISAPSAELLSNYTGFQNNLLNSNDAFTAIVDVNKVYTSEIDQIKNIQDQWQTSILNRENSLKEYDDSFAKLSVAAPLEQLTQMQNLMNEKHRSPVMLTDVKIKTEQLKEEISRFVKDVQASNAEIDATLLAYDDKILAAVQDSLAKTDSQNVQRQAESLGSYLKSIESLLKETFHQEFSKLIRYDNATIERMSISDADKQYLKAINAFAQAYATQNGVALAAPKSGSFQDNQLAEVQNFIKAELAKPQTVSITNLEGNISSIELTVPTGYTLRSSNLGFVPTGNGRYVATVANSGENALNVEYSLQAVDESKIAILTPLVSEVRVFTKEQFEYDKVDTQTTTVPINTNNTADNTVNDNNQTGANSATTNNNADTDVDKTTTVTKVIVNKETKTIDRHYTKSSVVYPYQHYTGLNSEQSAYNDFKSYFEFTGVVKSFYGNQFDGSSVSMNPTPDSLFGRLRVKYDNKAELEAIIVKLIQEATITELKTSLKIPDEQIAQFESLTPKAEELSTYVDELHVKTTQLLDELGIVVEDTYRVHETIGQKPIFVEQEQRDNSELVTVSLAINSDLEKLKVASQQLMENTKGHQAVSNTIHGQIEQLSNDVKSLETEGNNLSQKVDQLHTVMTDTHEDDVEFLKSFSTVLSNTKVGNEQNSAVYDYLANPVNSSKIESLVGAITKQENTRQDERSGFLLILFSYLVGLGVSYILQHSDRKKWMKPVEVISRRHWTNGLSAFLFLTGVAVLAAVVMGSLAGYKLAMSGGQLVIFVLLMFVVTQLFAHGVNSLSKTWKSYGFLLSLVLVMLYFISAGQLLDSQYVSDNSWIVALSPLTYLEQMVTAFLNNQAGWTIPFVITSLFATGVSVFTIYSYRELDEAEV